MLVHRSVRLDGFEGEVQSVSVLKQRVKVIVTIDNEEKEVREYDVDELNLTKETVHLIFQLLQLYRMK